MISTIIPLKYNKNRRYFSQGFSAQERTISALLSQKIINEVIVVNQASKEFDPQIAHLAKTFPSLKIINTEPNNYFFNQSWLLNIGILASNSEYIMRLDIDCILQPDLHERFTGTENFICCSVCDAPKTTNWEDFDYTKDFWKMIKKNRNNGWSQIIIKKSLLVCICGYDERYQVWGGEDEDLHKRLVKYGLVPEYRDIWLLHQAHTASGDSSANLHPDENKAKMESLAYLKDITITRNKNGWGDIKRPMIRG